MRLPELLSLAGAHKRPKRVGRGPGSGHGKTSCRGQKGQKARSGGYIHPWFEGGQMPLQRRVPKRGFTPIARRTFCTVNVAALERFEQGTTVTPTLLLERGLVKRRGGAVKILGEGELTKPLVVRANRFTRSARQKIEAVGGSVEVIT